MPEEFAHIWGWWFEARGAEPLTWLELRAWAEMTGRKLTGFEAETIMRIDAICRRVINER